MARTKKAKPERLALGTRVQFSRVLDRQRESRPDRGGRLRNEKTWTARPREGVGFLMGYRTVSNGYPSWEGEEEGTVWNPTAHIRCALVAVSLHRKPVHVPLDAIAPELELGLTAAG